MRTGPSCKVCGGASSAFGSARVLGRFDVAYFQCTACRFVQTEEPYWLADAYSSALIAADVGAVARSSALAGVTQTVIQQFGDPDATFLDWGGGYGLFVRMMRDRGFDFRWHDPYAANLHAVGFEAKPGDRDFALVTAFEVLEHVVDPVQALGEMLARSRDAVLCSTRILPASNPRPGEWWYYAPSGGQHIALYTLESLRRLAQRFGCRVASDGDALHLFVRRPISERLFRLVTRARISALLNRVRRRPSLVNADFERMTGSPLN